MVKLGWHTGTTLVLPDKGRQNTSIQTKTQAVEVCYYSIPYPSYEPHSPSNHRMHVACSHMKQHSFTKAGCPTSRMHVAWNRVYSKTYPSQPPHKNGRLLTIASIGQYRWSRSILVVDLYVAALLCLEINHTPQHSTFLGMFHHSK